MGPDSYSDPGLRYVFGAPSVGSMFVGSTYQSLHMPGIGVYGSHFEAPVRNSEFRLGESQPTPSIGKK